MINFNLIIFLFSSMTTLLLAMGMLVNNFEKYLPLKVIQFIRYGKFGLTEAPIFQKLQVPKSYYKHFYVHASIVTLSASCSLVYVFTFKVEIPLFVYDSLDCIAGSPRQARISNSNAMLALILFTLQCCRRFYDTHFISVFGESARIHVTHYIFAYVYFPASTLAILLESPIFVRNSSQDFHLSLMDLDCIDGLAVILFFWAWLHQLKVAQILANLRKDKKGNVVTETYKLPYGDWFDYVSSPHYLAEIIMYFALAIILRGSITWLFVFVFVLVNQIEAALLSHWWYKDRFTNLPKNRKAIFPFVY